MSGASTDTYRNKRKRVVMTIRIIENSLFCFKEKETREKKHFKLLKYVNIKKRKPDDT